MSAGTFQHGFLAVQPDEFCFQFFPLEVGPGAPLCKGGKEKGEQSEPIWYPEASQRLAKGIEVPPYCLVEIFETSSSKSVD